MSTKVQWRPQLNALTIPRSYKAQPVPKDSVGYDGIAKLISLKNPLWSQGLVKSVLLEEREAIREELIKGNRISYENTCSWHLSLAARLEAPDDPLPPAEDIVRVQIYASRTLVDEVRQSVQLERLSSVEKVPVIAGAEDTVLRLTDVLNPDGLLLLSGTNLFFDPREEGMECVLEGTRSGRTVQSRFGPISNSEVLVMPDVPAQNDPWNNEYRVSVTTRYTENGSLRTGSYSHPLRTPLSVTIGNDDGILSGSGRAPLVTVSNGSLSEESVRVRIQAVLDNLSGELRLNLLDMNKNGGAGDIVTVNDNGIYTLPGFTDSALSELEISVHRYSSLENMVRTVYTGRMVDILDVQAGT